VSPQRGSGRDTSGSRRRREALPDCQYRSPDSETSSADDRRRKAARANKGDEGKRAPPRAGADRDQPGCSGACFKAPTGEAPHLRPPPSLGETQAKFHLPHENFVHVQEALADYGYRPPTQIVLNSAKALEVAEGLRARCQLQGTGEKEIPRLMEVEVENTGWQVVSRKKQGQPDSRRQLPDLRQQLQEKAKAKGALQGTPTDLVRTSKGPDAPETFAGVAGGTSPIPWAPNEIKFHAVNPKETPTKDSWKQLASHLRLGHADWSHEYNKVHNEGALVKIGHPRWDADLRCGVIAVPVVENTRKVRDGFIPQLKLPVQLKATIMVDKANPVIKTLMTDEMYGAFRTEQHVEHMKQFNKILRVEPFEIRKCQRIEGARVLKITTSEKVVEYLEQHNFELPYPSGEVTFMREVHRATESWVTTVNPKAGAAPPEGHKGEGHQQKQVHGKGSRSTYRIDNRGQRKKEDAKGAGQKASTSKSQGVTPLKFGEDQADGQKAKPHKGKEELGGKGNNPTRPTGRDEPKQAQLNVQGPLPGQPPLPPTPSAGANGNQVAPPPPPPMEVERHQGQQGRQEAASTSEGKELIEFSPMPGKKPIAGIARSQTPPSVLLHLSMGPSWVGARAIPSPKPPAGSLSILAEVAAKARMAPLLEVDDEGERVLQELADIPDDELDVTGHLAKPDASAEGAGRQGVPQGGATAAEPTRQVE